MLTGSEMLALQGITAEDFPALRGAHSASLRSDMLLRDLSGNSFTATVCLGVLCACLAHVEFEERGEESVVAAGAWPAR